MELLKTLKELDGYWKYSGGQYLALLTSGKVSDEFCNTGVLTCKPSWLRVSVGHLLEKARDMLISPNEIYVCGPAMGGITLAYEVARQIGATGIFTEPVYEKVLIDGGVPDWPEEYEIEKTGQELKRFKIPEAGTVLFVEDVITTGKSTRQMVDAVIGDAVEWRCAGHKQPIPYVLCLVNRSGSDVIEFTSKSGGKSIMNIVSLAEINPRTWDTVEEAVESILDIPMRECTDEYRLEAVRPKDNWGLLTGATDG